MGKKKPRILGVDDDPINQLALRDSLEDAEYEVTIAKDGLAAIEAVENTEFDLILLDVMMPGIDGFETCRRLKQIPGAEDIPVIFLTARSSSEDIIKGFDVGAVDYISKPINHSVLYSRVKAHIGLKKHKDELEELIRERTATLYKTNTELEKALKKVEIAEQAKSSFTANMCHELRTPLNGILGTHELLLHEELGSSIKEMVGMSQQSTLSLITIINDILHFAEMTAGTLTLQNEPFIVAEIFEDILNMFKMHARMKDISLTLELSNSVPKTFIGDPRRIRQVALNIIGNAVKFTLSGTILVEVTSTLINSATSTLTFTVSDTGIGITEEEQQKLYQTFKQLDDSYTKQFGGIGIGLTNAKMLIELMNGSIECSSVKNEGTVFTTTIPLSNHTSK